MRLERICPIISVFWAFWNNSCILTAFIRNHISLVNSDFPAYLTVVSSVTFLPHAYFKITNPVITYHLKFPF